MISDKTFQPRLYEYSHPFKIQNWLAKQKCIASRLILAAIDIDRLVVHETATGVWLAKLDWSREQIAVIKADNDSLTYKFREFNSALGFLDAFLLHHFTRTLEACTTGTALTAPAA